VKRENFTPIMTEGEGMYDYSHSNSTLKVERI